VASKKTRDVSEMVGEFLREAAVLVLVFLPLEEAKGGVLTLPVVISIGALCIGLLLLGIAFEKWR
jgi:hypothetical protein